MYHYNRLFRFYFLVIASHLLAIFCSAEGLYVRVIDVGQGESVVAKMTDADGKAHYFVYDAGDGGNAMRGIHDVIPPFSTIELMVISHNDSDHIGSAKKILQEYHVNRIIHPGDDRGDGLAKQTQNAILFEAEHDSCENLDLAKAPIAPGTNYNVGDMEVTFIAGFSRPPPEFGTLNESEANNAGSIIIRLSYKGRSILLCGDAIGRHLHSTSTIPIASEKYVVDHVSSVPVKSDVIVASHHGADNGSSDAFIAAVHPEYVIFSAGHNANYRHPQKTTALRYLQAGVDIHKILRTDLGDDEGPTEWDNGRILGHKDEVDDDDIEIRISPSAVLVVRYSDH